MRVYVKAWQNLGDPVNNETKLWALDAIRFGPPREVNPSL